MTRKAPSASSLAVLALALSEVTLHVGIVDQIAAGRGPGYQTHSLPSTKDRDPDVWEQRRHLPERPLPTGMGGVVLSESSTHT